MNSRFTWFNVTAIVLGFAFLYIPILILVIYSFNESKLVTVWGGFSTKWYAGLLENEQLMDAAWITLQVAFISATIATVLGTMAALVLVRMGRFPGRTLFSGMIFAPLVMPEVITGLSLLLLFVAINFDRGFWTIVLAHATFTMCFAAVVVQARLTDFDSRVEEAAMDLGASPVGTFFQVTLPIIAPSVISAWLLAFTLSLDDLVIASFVAGPGSSTLPMVVFSKVRLGVSPDINALATILVAVVAVGVVIAGIAMSRQQKLRDRDAQMALAANQQMIESLKKG